MNDKDKIKLLEQIYRANKGGLLAARRIGFYSDGATLESILDAMRQRAAYDPDGASSKTLSEYNKNQNTNSVVSTTSSSSSSSKISNAASSESSKVTSTITTVTSPDLVQTKNSDCTPAAFKVYLTYVAERNYMKMTEWMDEHKTGIDPKCEIDGTIYSAASYFAKHKNYTESIFLIGEGGDVDFLLEYAIKNDDQNIIANLVQLHKSKNPGRLDRSHLEKQALELSEKYSDKALTKTELFKKLLAPSKIANPNVALNNVLPSRDEYYEAIRELVRTSSLSEVMHELQNPPKYLRDATNPQQTVVMHLENIAHCALREAIKIGRDDIFETLFEMGFDYYYLYQSRPYTQIALAQDLQAIDDEFDQFCKRSARNFMFAVANDVDGWKSEFNDIINKCKPYLLNRLQREFVHYLDMAYFQVFHDKHYNPNISAEERLQYANINQDRPDDINVLRFNVFLNREIVQFARLREQALQNWQPTATSSVTRK